MFVSHASEDHELAERIATVLTQNGTPAWYDGWEIRLGDSIRQKVDEGLQDCRALLVVLTKTSVEKEWVKSEVDAGFIRKFAGEGIRLMFVIAEPGVRLTPLMQTLKYTTLSGFDDSSLQGLAVEVARTLSEAPGAPFVGTLPAMLPPDIAGLDGLAEAVLGVLLKGARPDWPLIEVADLAKQLGVEDPQVLNDAVEYLRDTGLVQSFDHIGTFPYRRGGLRGSTKAFVELAPNTALSAVGVAQLSEA